MATLTRRLQVLLDEDLAVRLARESERTGAPIGALVRSAIARAYPSDLADRSAAAARLLAAEPMPVDGWSVVKQQLRDELADPEA